MEEELEFYMEGTPPKIIRGLNMVLTKSYVMLKLKMYVKVTYRVRKGLG